MRRHLRNTRRGWMIFNEAEKGGASGGAPATEPTAEEKAAAEKAAAAEAAANPDPANPPAATTQASAAKPSVFARATAMLKDKSELLTTISAHEGTIAALQGRLTLANETITAQNLQLAGMKELEATIANLEAGKKTVSAAATDQVAALGFPAADLPSASTAAAAETSGPEILAKFDAIKDPQEATTFYRANKAAIDAAHREQAKKN